MNKYKSTTIIALILVVSMLVAVAWPWVTTPKGVKAAGEPTHVKINQGEIVWMATLSQGEAVIVAYEYYGSQAYMIVSVTPDPLDPFSTNAFLFELPGIPKQLVVTGDLRTINMAVSVADGERFPIYLFSLDLQTAGVIDGAKSVVYLPITGR